LLKVHLKKMPFWWVTEPIPYFIGLFKAEIKQQIQMASMAFNSKV